MWLLIESGAGCRADVAGGGNALGRLEFLDRRLGGRAKVARGVSTEVAEYREALLKLKYIRTIGRVLSKPHEVVEDVAIACR